ncbi:MAG: transposase, partial [Burkholderiales bacterium]
MSKGNTVAPAAPMLSDWIDPFEQALRTGVHDFVQELLEAEVAQALNRLRYARDSGAKGYRNGHRARALVSTMGRMTVEVPRARVAGSDGKLTEFRSQVVPRYRRLTTAALGLIASAYLAGVNTRRVRRALGGLFGGAVSKDTVSRAWHKVQGDFAAWTQRRLKDEPIVRLILDGTVVKVRLDRKATTLSILVALGVRADGQKVLLALRAMGGESEAAWRALLD